MTEQPQSGDGLVYPDGFPCKASQIDAATIETAGANLKTMGVSVDSHMDTISATWGGLSAVYAGPGAEQAYALMSPAAVKSEELKQALSKAGDAIVDYAHELGPIKTTLTSLESAAESFRSAALSGEYGDDWKDSQTAVDTNAGYLRQYAQVFEQLKALFMRVISRRNATTNTKDIDCLMK